MTGFLCLVKFVRMLRDDYRDFACAEFRDSFAYALCSERHPRVNQQLCQPSVPRDPRHDLGRNSDIRHIHSSAGSWYSPTQNYEHHLGARFPSLLLNTDRNDPKSREPYSYNKPVGAFFLGPVEADFSNQSYRTLISQRFS